MLQKRSDILGGCGPRTRPVVLTLALMMLAPSAKAGIGETSGAVQPEEAVWVFFRDKGIAPRDLSFALQQRAQELSPETLTRRAKVRPENALLDIRDLDIEPSYEDGIEEISGSLRARSRWFNAVSTLASAEEIKQIETLSYVQKVVPVAHQGRRPEPQLELSDLRDFELPPRQLDYGNTREQLEQVGIPAAHECGLTGKGVILGVLDSGFQVAHEALGRVEVIDAYDFVHDDDEVANEAEDSSSQHNHGTSCLSLIAGWDPGEYIGAAPDVRVLLAKTEDLAQEDIVEEDFYVAGLEWAEANGAHITTSSLGYTDWYDDTDFDGKTGIATKAVDIAVENGLICLTAIGNDGPGDTTLSVPSDAFNVLTIGATDLSGTIANFSSRGPTSDGRIKPEFVAPGANVWVASAGGGYNRGSGTSYATPIAAGAVALLYQMNPDITPKEMRELLEATAKLSGSPNNTYGWGEIDVAAATKDFCSCQDADDDGHKDAECGGKDCDDGDADIHPDADEICDDGVDNNCDGAVDQDDKSCDESGDTESDTETTSEDPSESSSDETDSDSESTDDEDTSSEETGDKTDETPSDMDTPKSSDPNEEDDDTEPEGCACRSSGSTGSVAGLWALFGLIAWRRRRKISCLGD